MFGYVCPVENLLDQPAQTAFRVSYCGVCRCMGGLSRFALSYECVFLALFYNGLTAMPMTTRSACRGFPFRKKEMAIGEHEQYAADVNVLLAYYKACDDVRDGGGLKARLWRVALSRPKRRAAMRESALDAHIKRWLDALYRLEDANSGDGEALRCAFATLLCGVGAPGGDRYGALGRFFFDLGQWIYTVDALMDFDADRRAGRFNALASHGSIEAAREASSFLLWHTLSQMERSLTALNPSEPAMAVCKHILYDVLPAHTLKALGQGEGGLDSESLSGAGRKARGKRRGDKTGI